MAIVAVQRAEPKETAYDKLIKGLTIAQSVFGIKSALEQSEVRNLQKQELERQQKLAEEGAFSPQEYSQKFAPVPEENMVGSRPVKILGKEGIQEIQSISIPELLQWDRERKQQKIDKIKNDANKAENEAAKKEKNFEKINTIGRRYDSASAETLEAIRGYEKVKAAALNPDPSGATDLSLIFGFMKTIDPGSAVKEGEFKNAEETQPIAEQARVWRDKFFSQGDRLTSEQRKRLLIESQRGVYSQLKLQDITDGRYGSIADTYGLDRKFILNDIFAKTKSELEKLQSVTSSLPMSESQSGVRIKHENNGIPKSTSILPRVKLPAIFGSSPPQQPVSRQSDDEFINSYLGN